MENCKISKNLKFVLDQIYFISLFFQTAEMWSCKLLWAPVFYPSSISTLLDCNAHNANHNNKPVGGHVDQSSQLAQSMPKVECGEKCVNIKDYRWLSGETSLWRATQKEKGSGGKKYGGAVFVCKLIRERICKNETLTPLLLMRV